MAPKLRRLRRRLRDCSFDSPPTATLSALSSLGSQQKATEILLFIRFATNCHFGSIPKFPSETQQATHGIVHSIRTQLPLWQLDEIEQGQNCPHRRGSNHINDAVDVSQRRFLGTVHFDVGEKKMQSKR